MYNLKVLMDGRIATSATITGMDMVAFGCIAGTLPVHANNQPISLD